MDTKLSATSSEPFDWGIKNEIIMLLYSNVWPKAQFEMQKFCSLCQAKDLNLKFKYFIKIIF